MSYHRVQGNMPQKSDSQGSTPRGVQKTHKASEAGERKIQEQKTRTLKGNRETKASCLVIVGY